METRGGDKIADLSGLPLPGSDPRCLVTGAAQWCCVGSCGGSALEGVSCESYNTSPRSWILWVKAGLPGPLELSFMVVIEFYSQSYLLTSFCFPPLAPRFTEVACAGRRSVGVFGGMNELLLLIVSTEISSPDA